MADEELTRDQATAAVLIRQDAKSLAEGVCSVDEFFRRFEVHARVLRGELSIEEAHGGA